MNKSLSPVFQGLTAEERKDLAQNHCMFERHYKKGAVIFRMGDVTPRLGIVQNGQVHIENIDLWGNKCILSAIAPGQVFGETYALTGEILMVDAVATRDTDVWFLDVKKIMQERYETRSWYLKMLRNLLSIAARKNLVLSSRIFHTSSKHVRTRLQSYLSSCAIKAGSEEFDIPFNRQQLANYLNLDRSAMSKELGKMQKEGILDFHRNHFLLHNYFS